MPKTQRSTPFIEWLRVREDDGGYRTKAATSNAQRSTSNAQPASKLRFNLEDFSARIIRLADSLPNTRAANHIAGQVLRCGTSPYANRGEIEAAESRKDFIHKLKVCLKELKESRRWLRLLSRAGLVPAQKMAAILNETEQLIKIFFTSIRTAQKTREGEST